RLCLRCNDAPHSVHSLAPRQRGEGPRATQIPSQLGLPLPLTRLALSALATLSPQTAGRGCRPSLTLALSPRHAITFYGPRRPSLAGALASPKTPTTIRLVPTSSTRLFATANR